MFPQGVDRAVAYKIQIYKAATQSFIYLFILYYGSFLDHYRVFYKNTLPYNDPLVDFCCTKDFARIGEVG